MIFSKSNILKRVFRKMEFFIKRDKLIDLEYLNQKQKTSSTKCFQNNSLQLVQRIMFLLLERIHQIRLTINKGQMYYLIN